MRLVRTTSSSTPSGQPTVAPAGPPAAGGTSARATAQGPTAASATEIPAPSLPSHPALATVGDAAAVAAVKGSAALRAVPTLAALEGLKAGTADRSEVESALAAALTSNDPPALKKAAQTLQAAEAYQRKANEDARHYAGTGFAPMPFAGVTVRLDAAQTKKLVGDVASARDGTTADILALVSRRGLLVTEPTDAIATASALAGLRSGEDAHLPGSQGREAPRGDAHDFREEWAKQVAPGLTNIREAIVDTQKANGPGCPFPRGNHAKGIAFGDARMELSPTAPAWARELFGDSLDRGMIRVSGSQTNPNEPDTAAHMPGVRFVFPVRDGQTIDLTANTGATTHAQSAAEHTKFTQNIAVPKGPISGLRPVRAAKHLLGAVFGPGKVKERVAQMKNAVDVTTMAMGHKFHEHELFSRHAFFVGGRYVQVRFTIVDPKSFPDPSGDLRPNARLDVVNETVAKHGVTFAMHITELPPGADPEMVEREGWRGLPETQLATIKVPPQSARPDSAAARWFDDVPHVPGGADKVFHAVGLGRHRVPIYLESGKVRHGQ